MVELKPYCLPGTSIKNKTGVWADKQPDVDQIKCIGCGNCERFCPEGCIKIINKKAKVDKDYCKGCGICETVCPVKAIKMKKKE